MSLDKIRYRTVDHVLPSLSVTNMEADTSQSHAGRKISSYSTEFKLEAIKFADKCKSISKAAVKFHVDRKRIREWRRIQSELQATNNKRKRLEGGGRKPFDVDLEDWSF